MRVTVFNKVYFEIFKNSYARSIKKDLGIKENKEIIKKARHKYYGIIKRIPSFDKGDRYFLNILSCAQFSAILLCLPRKISLEEATTLYKNGSTNKIMIKYLVREIDYTKKGQEKIACDAIKSKDRENQFTWRYDYIKGSDDREYTLIFHSCGIRRLMNYLGLKEYVKAMCAYDYEMARLNHTEFSRTKTLEEGDEFCDCHYLYKKQVKKK